MSFDLLSSDPKGPELLFVYGTLHPDRAPEEVREDVKRLIFVESATVQGELYELAEYPALVLEPGSSAQVHGFLFELPEDPALLARLDAYEGFLPTDPESSLFLRQPIQATLPDDSVITAQTYIYNRKIVVLSEK